MKKPRAMCKSTCVRTVSAICFWEEDQKPEQLWVALPTHARTAKSPALFSGQGTRSCAYCAYRAFSPTHTFLTHQPAHDVRRASCHSSRTYPSCCCFLPKVVGATTSPPQHQTRNEFSPTLSPVLLPAAVPLHPQPHMRCHPPPTQDETSWPRSRSGGTPRPVMEGPV